MRHTGVSAVTDTVRTEGSSEGFGMGREAWLELFAALASGRTAALERLYDVAAGPLFGLALWRTRCREDAGDVVHEVFVRVAEQRDRLAGVANPRAWLLTVTHRAAVDLTRRRAVRRAEPLDDVLLMEAPAEDRERAVDARRASRLLLRLTPKQRDAVYLHHYAGCTFAEIGRITGVPTFTAASRYRLGMRALRRLLGEPS